jgi:hypothetical protein
VVAGYSSAPEIIPGADDVVIIAAIRKGRQRM